MKRNPVRFNDSTAIILAGGAGRRMKRDKKFLTLPEGFLIDVVINNLKNRFKDIVISVSSGSDFKKDNHKVVKDLKPGHGPLMGIYCGLKESTTEKNFIIAVDIPEINYELIDKMYGYSDEYDIVVPVNSSGEYEPLFSFVSKRTIPAIEKMLLLNRNKILLLYPECRTRKEKMENDNWMKNLNTPSDFEEYLSEKSGID